MSKLALSLLGPPVIVLDDKPIAVDTRKAIALLAYLAVRGKPSRRESLTTIFWPESDPTHAKAALRRTISALNKGLKRKWLAIDRETVGLVRENGFWMDITEFVGLIDGSNNHHHSTNEICAKCIQDLIKAVDLYRDDFLAGFTLRDSPSFDEWQFFQTEEFRHTFGLALDRLVALLSADRDYARAIPFAKRRLVLDSLHEAAHRQLMKLYAWSDQRSAALRQYHACVRLLDQELKVPPLEETTALYGKILGDSLEPPGKEGSARSSEGKSRSTTALEETPRPLIGRVKEWQTLVDRYEAANTKGQFVVIEGEMGIGKTHLANAFLKHAGGLGARIIRAASYPGETNLSYGPFIEALRTLQKERKFSADLARVSGNFISEAARLLPDLRATFSDLPELPALDSPGAQIRFFEGINAVILGVIQDDHPGIFFLDDLHYADDATLDLLAYFVRRIGHHRILVLTTWRPEESLEHRLRYLAAEAHRQGTGHVISLARMTAAETVELIQSLPSTEGVSEGLLGERLYAESEGLPFFLVEYVAAIQRMLGEGKAIDWALPRNVRTILRQRIASISEAALQLVTAAAVIGPPFDYRTLLKVSGRDDEEAVAALEELTSKWILQELKSQGRRSEGPVYGFRHEKLRDLIYEDASQARRRMLHKRTAKTLLEQTIGAQELEGKIAHHFREAGQEQAALEHYISAADHARSLYANQDALAHYQSALALDPPEPVPLLEATGDLHTRIGEYNRAIANYEAAAAYEENHDKMRMHRKLGAVYHRKGQWQLAENHFKAASEAHQDAENEREKALLLADWAHTAYRSGDLDRALYLADQALDLSENRPDVYALAQSHNILGILYRNQGELNKAEEHLRSSLAASETMDLQVAAMNNLALLYAEKGLFEQGLEIGQTALHLCLQIGDRHRQAALHSNLADFNHALGRKDESMAQLKKSAAIYAEIGVEAGTFEPEIWKLTEW